MKSAARPRGLRRVYKQRLYGNGHPAAHQRGVCDIEPKRAPVGDKALLGLAVIDYAQAHSPGVVTHDSLTACMDDPRKFKPEQSAQLFAGLQDWFKRAGGASIRDAELEVAASILPNLFGYHIVQLGNYVAHDFIASTRISHSMILDSDAGEGQVSVVSSFAALPLATNSIDVLVAPHVLDFADQPHAVLREAERILIGEGHIMILGFNPWSWCGLWRIAAGWRGRAPWCGHFLSAARIKDWLKLLGFEIEVSKKTSFRFPVRREKAGKKRSVFDQLGAHWWPFFGNVYIVVAKKRDAAVTPLKSSWRTRRKMIATGVAEPTARRPHPRKCPATISPRRPM